MATYDAEVIAQPPQTLEADKASRDAEISVKQSSNKPPRVISGDVPVVKQQ